jgi:dipeptidyl aminopeptidase/acylaminoacyl peptidase
MRRMILMAAALLSCAAVSFAEPPKQYEVRDFFRNSERSSFRVSPDGKTLSFMQPYQNRMNIFVQGLDAKGKLQGEPKRLTSETARDIAGYFWKGNQSLLYVKDFGGDENFHVVAVAIDGSGTKDLTPYEKVQAGVIDDLEDDPQHVLVQHNNRDKQVFDVYRIDVNSGESVLLAENPGNITGWVTDHEGRLRAAVTSDGVNTSLLYRDQEADKFRTLLTTNFKESVQPLLFTADNKQLYVSSNRGRDKAAIRTLDPATAKEGAVLFEHPDYDVDGVQYSRLRKQVESFSVTTWKNEFKFVDPVAEKRQAVLAGKLAGYEFVLQSRSKDETRFIVAAFNDRTQGARYLFDAKSGSLTKLGELAPWLAEADMAPMKAITYKSRDGLTIHGYLTLPKGVPATNLPVVVNPHGGPWARDVWGYNPEVQLLANRGYAVLQMNFRGSTGYGREFWERSFKQWGGAMQDDITDGVQWLIKQGIADPKRVAIYGGSYGGYATLSGITKTPELYAAAIDYVGVSNMFTFMSSIPPYWEPLRKMFYEMAGDPVADEALLRSVSPVYNVEKIKTPLLVVQGANDPRVKQAESEQIVEALRKRGVSVQYILKQNEGHGFHNEENRIEFYEAMVKFLGEHVPVKPRV